MKRCAEGVLREMRRELWKLLCRGVQSPALNLTPNSQKVASPNFPDLGLGIPPLQQSQSDVKRVTCIAVSRYTAAVIEIRSNADVINTHQRYDMINMIQHCIQ